MPSSISQYNGKNTRLFDASVPTEKGRSFYLVFVCLYGQSGVLGRSHTKLWLFFFFFSTCHLAIDDSLKISCSIFTPQSALLNECFFLTAWYTSQISAAKIFFFILTWCSLNIFSEEAPADCLLVLCSSCRHVCQCGHDYKLSMSQQHNVQKTWRSSLLLWLINPSSFIYWGIKQGLSQSISNSIVECVCVYLVACWLHMRDMTYHSICNLCLNLQPMKKKLCICYCLQPIICYSLKKCLYGALNWFSGKEDKWVAQPPPILATPVADICR